MNRRSDLVSGVILFVFALAYGFGARGLTASGEPGVAVVPIGLAVALAALSAGIALSGWRKARQTSVSQASDSNSSRPAPSSPGPVRANRPGPPDNSRPARTRATQRPPATAAGPTRAWTVIALTILYAALFQVLGYVVATLFYTAAVADRFGARRRTILVLAPSVTLLAFLLFRAILGARLPAGWLG